MKVELHILDTGYTETFEGVIARGGGARKVICHSLVGLIMHPERGAVLFDTGYAPRILDASKRFPYRLYRWITPLHVRDEWAVVEQLGRFGLAGADVRYVVLSHFHADHLAGLKDFPGAKIVATRDGYADVVARRRGWRALMRAFLPALMPRDFAKRAVLLGEFRGESVPGLGVTHDLFGDGSIRLVRLPGHARGQLGALVETTEGTVLLAADGCWLTKQVREERLPSIITKLIVDDMDAVADTIHNLHVFAEARPDVRIVPCHCPEAHKREVTGRP